MSRTARNLRTTGGGWSDLTLIPADHLVLLLLAIVLVIWLCAWSVRLVARHVPRRHVAGIYVPARPSFRAGLSPARADA